MLKAQRDYAWVQGPAPEFRRYIGAVLSTQDPGQWRQGVPLFHGFVVGYHRMDQGGE